MKTVALLLVGDATDGPEGELYQVTSLDAALRLFGAYRYTAVLVTSGSTSTDLPEVPWGGDVLPLKADSDGVLVLAALSSS